MAYAGDNMGIDSLKDTIREIEKVGKTGMANDSHADLLKAVSKKISQVINALQKEFEATVS